METLVKLPKIKTMSNVKDLRHLYDQVEMCIKNLRALKVETKSYGSLVIPLLTEKLPEELRLVISRKFGSDLWTLDDILLYFKEELQAKERCCFDSPEQKKTIYRDSLFTASNLFNSADEQASREQQVLICVFCNKDHPPSKCKNVSDVKTRITILRKKGRCFICLRSGHIASKCPSNYSCRLCNKRHNISICDKVLGQTKETIIGTTQTTSGGDILLQTGRAKVFNTDQSRKYVHARILLDGGSQCSYICDSVRSALDLPTICKEKVISKTFGQNNATPQEIDVVQLKIENKITKGFVFIEALCVPYICSPLKHQNIVKAVNTCEHMQGSNLSDYSNGKNELEVNILKGL